MSQHFFKKKPDRLFWEEGAVIEVVDQLSPVAEAQAAEALKLLILKFI